MIKPLISVLNIGIILIIGEIFGGVDITHNFPAQVNSGSRFTVEFVINKGEIDRYARLTIEVPNGFKASAKETHGGQFSFEDQKAIVHWYNLPYDEVLHVILNFDVAPPISGEFNITGAFRYIDNNRIQEKTITPHKIKVVQVEGVTDLLASQRYKYKEITLKPIDCIRQKPYMNEDNEIVVNLLVSKANLNSFGKIEEQIPRGYRAVANKTKGAIFQVSGRVVKFLWMELPKDEADKMFIVSYKLFQTEEFPNQAFIINGTFSYSQDDRTFTINIAERNVDLNAFEAEMLQSIELTKDEQLAEIEKEKKEKKVDVLSDEGTFTGTEGVATSDKINELVKEEKTFEQTLTPEELERYKKLAESKKKQSETVTQNKEVVGEIKRPEIANVSLPDQGITYRVQIAASHKLVKKDYFKRFNINDPVQVELHEGWHKYTVGKFRIYKDARDYRNKIWQTTPIIDAFVCAYNDGIRITVQEALMIANQQWFK
ncbi:MAG TPA: hypothetical protein PK990_04425 [Salinivirgaceae bacterium]|nr:hypothetical protein [Salinivirgaceae bacterium]